jgi:hypothetical protein
MAFNNIYWQPSKALQKIWLGLIEYGHNEWVRMKGRRGGLAKFVAQWCRNDVIVKMHGEKPQWHFKGPVRLFS